MKKFCLIGVTAAAMSSLMVSSATAQTQWIQDTLSDQCSAASQAQIADATRESIEESIARAEASIQAPASVADLSCLNSLLSADLDVFSSGWLDVGSFNVDGMINDVVGGLKSGLSVQTLTTGVERAICQFAQEKFSELTNGIDGTMDEIVSGASVSIPDFTDGFGLMNISFDVATGTSASTGTQQPATPAPPVSVQPTTTPAPAANPGTDTSTEESIQNIWDAIKG